MEIINQIDTIDGLDTVQERLISAKEEVEAGTVLSSTMAVLDNRILKGPFAGRYKLFGSGTTLAVAKKVFHTGLGQAYGVGLDTVSIYDVEESAEGFMSRLGVRINSPFSNDLGYSRAEFELPRSSSGVRGALLLFEKQKKSGRLEMVKFSIADVAYYGSKSSGVVVGGMI